MSQNCVDGPDCIKVGIHPNVTQSIHSLDEDADLYFDTNLDPLVTNLMCIMEDS